MFQTFQIFYLFHAHPTIPALEMPARENYRSRNDKFFKKKTNSEEEPLFLNYFIQPIRTYQSYSCGQRSLLYFTSWQK